MRRISLVVMIGGLFLLLAASDFGQEPGARDWWLKSREEPKATPILKPKPTPKPTPKNGAPTPKPTPVAERALGLGYTLFLKNEAGDFVRAKTTREFHSGEVVRFLVESSRDGYVYVFHQENDETPVMLFPHWQIQRGDNRIRAHEPLWVPAGGEIVFDEKTGTEKLTLVVSQEPISELPSGEALAGKESVPVPEEVFQRVSRSTLARADAPLREGEKLTLREGERGVKMRVTDPPPAYSLRNQDPQESRIVASIPLKHR